MNRRRLTRRACALIVVLALLCSGLIVAHAVQVTCPLCGGMGRSFCGTCGGDGRVLCFSCGGLGQVSQQTFNTDPVTGVMIPSTMYLPCTGCGGTGSQMCTSCAGTGGNTCTMCGGTGYVENGSGSGSSSGTGESSGDSGNDSGAFTGDWSDGGFTADSPDPGVPYAMKNGTVLAATKSHYDFEGVKCLFDGDKYTKYCTITTSAYIVWKAPKPIAVSGYKIMTGNDNSYYNGRNPKSWVLYGSTKKLGRKDSGWVKIHKVTNDKTLKDVDYKSYSFTVSPASKAYQYFKLEILDNCGDGCIQMSEFTLKGTETAEAAKKETVTTATVNKLKYAVNTKAKTAVFTGPSKKTVTKIDIPNTVKAGGVKCKVIGIQASACKSLKKLTTVSIGDYVTSIGKSAFAGCPKLKTVTGGKKLATIGKQAFKDCAVLAKFTFYTKVKSIGDKAFYGCKKLKTLVFKTEKLTSGAVGTDAFKGTYKKAAITCPKSKKKDYKKLLVKKGMNKKATFK